MRGGDSVMGEGSEAPILELENITKIYSPPPSLFHRETREIVALDRISLAIHRGEIVGLVGESGSGKTTAGRLMVRLEDPEEGRILFKGEETVRLKGSQLKRFRKSIQMIFQDPYQSLNPRVSVLNTVSEPLAIHKLGNEGDRGETVGQVLRSVGLSPPEEFLHRYPHQLSGGQRQRVAIARAMVLNPEVVIADEPTSMLDASISAHIFNILLDMRDNRDIAVVFITHNLAAARYLCNRIAVIYKGRLMEIGPADRVIQAPRHPYTQALLDAIPGFKNRSEAKKYGTLLRHERRGAEPAGCPFFPRCSKANENRCNDNAPQLIELESSHSAACFYA